MSVLNQTWLSDSVVAVPMRLCSVIDRLPFAFTRRLVTLLSAELHNWMSESDTRTTCSIKDSKARPRASALGSIQRVAKFYVEYP
jgi:hypothetical protein